MDIAIISQIFELPKEIVPKLIGDTLSLLRLSRTCKYAKDLLLTDDVIQNFYIALTGKKMRSRPTVWEGSSIESFHRTNYCRLRLWLDTFRNSLLFGERYEVFNHDTEFRIHVKECITRYICYRKDQVVYICCGYRNRGCEYFVDNYITKLNHIIKIKSSFIDYGPGYVCEFCKDDYGNPRIRQWSDYCKCGKLGKLQPCVFPKNIIGITAAYEDIDRCKNLSSIL